MTAAARILVVDNHDSFVHTLVDYLVELGAGIALVEADAIDDDRAAAAIDGFDGVLVSPGPGTPGDAGASVAVVRTAVAARTPLLGVCLGHQALAEAFGAKVAEAPELRHGMTSQIWHRGGTPFEGMPAPFAATRYHSLAIVPETVPEVLAVTARTASGVVMGIAHRDAPAWGVQFHPESVLTEGGYLLLGNWLATAGMPAARQRAAGLSPRRT